MATWSEIIHPGITTDYGSIGYVKNTITAYDSDHGGKQDEMMVLREAVETNIKTGETRISPWWFISGTRDKTTGTVYQIALPDDMKFSSILVEDINKDFLPNTGENAYSVVAAHNQKLVPYVPENLDIPSIVQTWFIVLQTNIRQMTQCSFMPLNDRSIQIAEAWWVAEDHGTGLWRVGAGNVKLYPSGNYWPINFALPGRSAWYTAGPNGRFLSKVKVWYAHDEAGNLMLPQEYGVDDHNLAV